MQIPALFQKTIVEIDAEFFKTIIQKSMSDLGEIKKEKGLAKVKKLKENWIKLRNNGKKVRKVSEKNTLQL